MAKRLPPLNGNHPIVDSKGNPSPDFLLLINALLGGRATDAATIAQEALDAATAASTAVAELGDNEIVAGTGLTGGGLLSDPDIDVAMADTAVTPGTYGSGTKVPVVTIDQQGRVTHAEEAGVSGIPPGGTVGQVLGKLSGTDYDADWIDQSGGGGGGSTPPVMRSSNIVTFNAGSYNAPFPAGTVAGDTVFLVAGHAYEVAPDPSGWVKLDHQSGSNYNGSVYSRGVTAADITLGYVYVPFGGGYYGTIVMVTFIGLAALRPPLIATRLGGGPSTVTVGSDGSPQVTDIVLYFGSNRGNSVDTVDRGTQIQQAQSGDSSGVLTWENPPVGGVIANFDYSGATGGSYSAVIPVKGG